MIRLEWSSRFEKSLKKWIAKHPESREVIKQKLEQFTANPYDPELKNHKLSGQLKDLRVAGQHNRPFPGLIGSA